MMQQACKRLVVILAVCLVAGGMATGASADTVTVKPGQTASADRATELRVLEEGLPAKQAELQQLHRKWVIARGRLPTAAELEQYREKQAKGAVTVTDNPYVNRNPLSSPGRYRAAYYKKRDEIRADEARIAQLRLELAAGAP